MTHSFDQFVVKAYEGRTAQEIAHAACDALSGVSPTDRLKLEEALGIQTVHDLAENPFFRRASAIAAAASDTPVPRRLRCVMQLPVRAKIA